jgi:hypothetical protein
MTDRTERLLEQARIDALRDVVPPGVDQVRRTVRRRRGAGAGAGVAVAVAAIASGIVLTGGRLPDVAPLAGPSSAPASGPRTEGVPHLNPTASERMAAASAALGDPDATPWVMATTGVVRPDYENHVNDIPAGDYQLFVYCVGEGTVDVVVKAGDHGDEKLAAGSVACSAKPAPGRLAVTQPFDGYLRVFLSGDARASAGSAFSFKFVRDAQRTQPAGRETIANASTAAMLLTNAGVPHPTKVTTERDKTVEEPRQAGNYLVSFACAGPGRLSFVVRSARILRDGTVATNGRTETAVDHECTSAGKVTSDVAVSLPSGSALTITADVDDAARGRAGWAYAISPA